MNIHLLMVMVPHEGVRVHQKNLRVHLMVMVLGGLKFLGKWIEGLKFW